MRADDHTLQCKTRSITYIPIPRGASINYAGLFSVELPSGIVHQGQIFNIVVRQVTNSFSRTRKVRETAAAVTEYIQWRRVLGAFQLTIPVKNKEVLLVTEERELSVLRWIGEAIPHYSRWYPVFRRYLEQIADRVKIFGGDPMQILPSPTGEDFRKHRRPEEPKRERRIAYTGKIVGLIFDHFGDFEGFLLDTEHGEHKFFSREKEVEELAERVWRERLRITVWVGRDDRHRPLSIIVREPPAPFYH